MIMQIQLLYWYPWWFWHWYLTYIDIYIILKSQMMVFLLQNDTEEWHRQRLQTIWFNARYLYLFKDVYNCIKSKHIIFLSEWQVLNFTDRRCILQACFFQGLWLFEHYHLWIIISELSSLKSLYDFLCTWSMKYDLSNREHLNVLEDVSL